jgi:hypothetical protein
MPVSINTNLDLTPEYITSSTSAHVLCKITVDPGVHRVYSYRRIKFRNSIIPTVLERIEFKEDTEFRLYDNLTLQIRFDPLNDMWGHIGLPSAARIWVHVNNLNAEVQYPNCNIFANISMLQYMAMLLERFAAPINYKEGEALLSLDSTLELTYDLGNKRWKVQWFDILPQYEVHY